jgi:hypothetical protein
MKRTSLPLRRRTFISVDLLILPEAAQVLEVSFELEDDALVPFALGGDWKPLISYIEKGGDINGDIRNFILDVLKGKVRRPNNRPRRAATLLHHAKIAWHVRKWRADGLRPEAAIEKAIQTFDVDRRTVQRALKDCAH